MNPNAIPPDILADLEAIARQTVAGSASNPELLLRIRERSAKARDELLRRHGERSVAVELLRDSRDEG